MGLAAELIVVVFVDSPPFVVGCGDTCIVVHVVPEREALRTGAECCVQASQAHCRCLFHEVAFQPQQHKLADGVTGTRAAGVSLQPASFIMPTCRFGASLACLEPPAQEQHDWVYSAPTSASASA